MGSDTKEGWSNFPRELLLRIFRTLAREDRRLLHPLTQVCSHWCKTIKSDIFADYSEYLSDVKINLKFKKIVNNNVVVNNLFTCFYLAEYDEDYLFWPKQTTDNVVYCSEIRGNFQVISYEITSQYIDYIKLTGSDYVEKPTDCYRAPYQQFSDVSPFSGSISNGIELIKQNEYPTLKKSLYTVCLYSMDLDSPRSSSLTYHSNCIRYHLNTNKRVNYATISQNNKYLVLAFSGLIQVYHLPSAKSNSSVSLNNLQPCFSKQQPSIVKYLAIDDDAHVLFLKSLRLGGLSIINMITEEELEFPHYRLDLNMSSQINDHILVLNGYQETIIYGLPFKPKKSITNSTGEFVPRSNEKVQEESADDDYLKNIKKLKLLPDEVPIWNYFENHINASLEVIVPLNNVLPTDAPGCFIGLIKGCSFAGKSESIFSGSTNDRSIDLVLLIDKSYPCDLNRLAGQYLEDFSEDDPEAESNDVLHGVSETEVQDTADEESDEDEGEGEANGSFDDFAALTSQFKVVPLIYNVQYLSRSSLLSISEDGKRFAILINNLLFVMNVSAESILLILEKFNKGTFKTLDLLTMFNVYTDPSDFHLELASSLPAAPGLASSTFTLVNNAVNANIFLIDELLHLPEYKEQHKRFNTNTTAIDSDDDDEDGELLSDDQGTSDGESFVNGNGPAARGRSTHLSSGSRGRISDRKPQLIWQGKDKIAINFNGNLTILLTLERFFDFE